MLPHVPDPLGASGTFWGSKIGSKMVKIGWFWPKLAKISKNWRNFRKIEQISRFFQEISDPRDSFFMYATCLLQYIPYFGLFVFKCVFGTFQDLSGARSIFFRFCSQLFSLIFWSIFDPGFFVQKIGPDETRSGHFDISLGIRLVLHRVCQSRDIFGLDLQKWVQKWGPKTGQKWSKNGQKSPKTYTCKAKMTILTQNRDFDPPGPILGSGGRFWPPIWRSLSDTCCSADRNCYV